MSEGSVTLTNDGKILHCNPRFADIVESPYEKVVGSSLSRFISPNDNSKLVDFLARLSNDKHDVIIVSLINTIYLRLSIHFLPPYLQGDNFIIVATDISDLKKKENELNQIIGKLGRHIKALQTWRIDNICETLDIKGSKYKTEVANNQLHNEILKLKRLVAKL